MKLLENKKAIIAVIIIIVLLLAIGGVIYSMYNSNKQQTIAQPINEDQQEVEENKNIVDINDVEETTREYS